MCTDFLAAPNGPAFVVVPGATIALSRIHFYDGRFSCGDGNDKIGTLVITSVVVSRGAGIRITVAQGYTIDVPWHLVRTVTHK